MSGGNLSGVYNLYHGCYHSNHGISNSVTMVVRDYR